MSIKMDIQDIKLVFKEVIVFVTGQIVILFLVGVLSWII